MKRYWILVIVESNADGQRYEVERNTNLGSMGLDIYNLKMALYKSDTCSANT